MGDMPSYSHLSLPIGTITFERGCMVLLLLLLFDFFPLWIRISIFPYTAPMGSIGSACGARSAKKKNGKTLANLANMSYLMLEY